MDAADADAEHQRLRVEKAERLAELKERKPGQKGYRRRLRAFLEADAAAEKALLKRLELLSQDDGARATQRDDGA